MLRGRSKPVFDTISGALKRGDEVRLVGFGTFSCSRRKASTGRNPRTGEPMQIKESTQPKFKPGKGLKDAGQRIGICSAGRAGQASGRSLLTAGFGGTICCLLFGGRHTPSELRRGRVAQW